MNTTSSGSHQLATLSRMCALSVAPSSVLPCLRTTTSSGRSCHLGCATPITAACSTSGCPQATPSSAIVLIHSPPDLMTSLERSVSAMCPYLSIVATSPVLSQPSSSSALPPSPLK